jgi:hypothetical protein
MRHFLTPPFCFGAVGTTSLTLCAYMINGAPAALGVFGSFMICVALIEAARRL